MRMRRTRFLPKAIAAELWRLPWRLLGLALAGVAIAGWLSLITWSSVDPSLNYATDTHPRNILGYRGAAVSDALFQAFGLSAALLIFPIAALGVQIVQGVLPISMKWRLFFWILSLGIVPTLFSSFSAPSRWTLSHGLGGVVGDLFAAQIATLSKFAPSYVLWPLAVAILASIGFWSLLRACGLFYRHVVEGVMPQENGSRGSAHFDGPTFKPAMEERMARRFTSWTSRFSPRFRALTATATQPREFWMTPPGKKKGKSLAVKPGRPAETQLATVSPQKSAAASPFANWGQRSASRLTADRLAGFQLGGGREEKPKEEAVNEARIEPFFGPSSAGGQDRGPFGGGEEEENVTAPYVRISSKAKSIARKSVGQLFEASNAVFGDRERAGRVKEREDISTFEPEPVDFSTNLPPLRLLSLPRRQASHIAEDEPQLVEKAAMLTDVLGDFGVKGRIAGIYPGPVITLFELEPARGTKSSRVVGLADDIARSMSATSARVAVVPGRDAIGIELPNQKRETVALREILESTAFEMSQSALPLALGKSIGGEPIVVDLARMPHLLIAGTTGSGKSVGINTMILSLLYRLPPSQCNFIMIDPKMLELSVYDGIPHLLAPVVTDPKKAVSALKWTVKEMNSRYERMSKLGVRNITSYNSKVATATLRGQPLKRIVQTGFDPDTDEPIEEEETFEAVPMPYIVVVIDEMADLMMVAGKDIEFCVQRLSQMARAAGIHLIMATQRPSVDVVTGTIKANFPSRISFQVTSKIDSRTIIGEQGAEQLLGAGDMLYMASGGRIIRAHGPFVSDDEVEAVARYLKAQGFPSYRDDILEDTNGFEDAPLAKDSGDRSGELYDKAVDIVLKDRKPTTSYLQRRLGIGYNRAASLIERMEQEGIVGAPTRTGRREILVDATH